MKPLVAVDWGTSSLRVARIDAQGCVREERSSNRGILSVAAGEFPGVLEHMAGDWLAHGEPLCLVSGMAGSRQGWSEAPYCPCPAGFGQLKGQLHWVADRVAIVPGLWCEHGGVPDVMRGEEVQVFGALALLGQAAGLFVLPGTHSKWAQVADGRITGFRTSMSGEIYALLREHSLLSRSLPATSDALDADALVKGVLHAQAHGSLLATAFSVRTLSLFDRMPAAALPSYLSGLVIGEELRTHCEGARPVVLVGSEGLTERYALALRALEVPCTRLGAQATWRGLWEIACALEGG